MGKWFAYFRDNGKLPHFKLVSACDLHTAEMMANELASRNKSKCIGVITAPEIFQG